MRTVSAMLLIPTFACAQIIADLPDIVSNRFKLRSIRILAGRGGIPTTLIVSIESPADWDWNKGLKIEFAIAGGEDGNVLCGIYEAVLTKRLGNIAQIPVRLLNPGGLCKPGEIQVHSLGIAEERIKAELEKKRSAEEAEARRVYLAQFP